MTLNLKATLEQFCKRKILITKKSKFDRNSLNVNLKVIFFDILLI